MTKKKKNISSKIKKKVVLALNKSLIPAEYSFKTFKKLVKNIKKTAPLVYDEIDALIKSILLQLIKEKKYSKKLIWQS